MFPDFMAFLYNIKINIRGLGDEDADCIPLAQDRVTGVPFWTRQ
jgi:hypothetical protein